MLGRASNAASGPLRPAAPSHPLGRVESSSARAAATASGRPGSTRRPVSPSDDQLRDAPDDVATTGIAGGHRLEHGRADTFVVAREEQSRPHRESSCGTSLLGPSKSNELRQALPVGDPRLEGRLAGALRRRGRGDASGRVLLKHARAPRSARSGPLLAATSLPTHRMVSASGRELAAKRPTSIPFRITRYCETFPTTSLEAGRALGARRRRRGFGTNEPPARSRPR